MTIFDMSVEDEPLYTVLMTPMAEEKYKGVSSRTDFEKLDKMILLLDTVPEIGRVYDPDYEAAAPSFQARVTYAGRYGIYYTVDEDAKVVTVFAIEDQRANPLNRFYGIYPHETR